MDTSAYVNEQEEILNDLWNGLNYQLEIITSDLDPELDTYYSEALREVQIDEFIEKWEELELLAEDDIRDKESFEKYNELSDRMGDSDSIEHPDYLPFEDIYVRQEIYQKVILLKNAVSKRDIELSQGIWDELSGFLVLTDNRRSWRFPDVLVEGELRDEIDGLLEEISIHTPTIIYKEFEKPTKLETSELLVSLYNLIAHQIASDPSLFYKLTPREFEEFIAEIFSSFGYRVELTARTRDGGRDIIAIGSHDDILTKLIIECKRFAPHRKVGLSYIRELYTVKALEHASKAILATTSFFTRDARILERKLIYELELKDFNAITNWAKQYSEFLKKIRHVA